MAAELAVMLYQDYVRRWLLKMSGYECQQADGGFMLAFASPLNAIHFCLVVRRCNAYRHKLHGGRCSSLCVDFGVVLE